jgi:sporulation protein YabP
MEELRIANVQKISLTNRGQGLVTGVKDVLAFDTEEVLLDTELGVLQIKGADMHVVRLTLEKGEVAFEGRIDAMTYSDVAKSGSQESFWSRVFR